MPRKDRSFTAPVVLRIIEKYVTPDGKEKIRLALNASIDKSEMLNLVYAVIGALALITSILRPLLRFFWLGVIINIILTTLDLVEALEDVLKTLAEFIESL